MYLSFPVLIILAIVIGSYLDRQEDKMTDIQNKLDDMHPDYPDYDI